MKISEMSVELIDSMGDDLSVVNAARVSFAKQSTWLINNEELSDGLIKNANILKDQDTKLIHYLAKHKHWTPFAHAFASFRIKAPIFVARQLVKHQVGLAWNEESRRYIDSEPEFWFPKEWRGKPVNAKQGSSGPISMREEGLDWDYAEWVYSQTHEQLNLYNGLLSHGVAPEQARMVLPQNTMTEWIWSGSLAAFARVCKLRLDNHAQQETREVVSYIRNYMVELFPVSFNALMEN